MARIDRMLAPKIMMVGFTAVFAWNFLFFSFGEGLLLGFSFCIAVPFLYRWYLKTRKVTQFFEDPKRRRYLMFLPFIPVLLYLLTLTTVASWDVIVSVFYIIFYLFVGIAWVSLSFDAMLLFWSFSYEDDVLMGTEKAPLILLTGAMAGVSLIYAGANIGDGPGWWTVVFAGGLGTVAWLFLGGIISWLTSIIEMITIDRDVNSGIRFAGYLLASGVILARASAGDWTSFTATVQEFGAGWPVIPLAILMIFLERTMFKGSSTSHDERLIRIKSVCAAVIYILYGVSVLFLLPSIF